ncbi:type II secretion system F family protein [Blautia sp. MSJ-19]|uniref:type II secretion system F family protein n=1 Tax=Blautia sp. MSJ-19 TaxID=2841517 RepID=UPI001C0EF6B1|nr:type II secretion system F family protein [Blautia sp. MSJ-19]MBU5482442.1 type II secretion system F family protein [Blautia sp. MSJ-19]
MKQNYEEYHFTAVEVLKYLFQCLLLCSILDYLFYQNIWMMLLAAPAGIFFMKIKKKSLIRERKKTLNYQFKDALNALSVAVQAGYSVENAVAACSRDLERLYSGDADIVQEFHYIETQLKVSVPVEELFLSLGDRSGIEDMENFAAVFYTAKRTGGDMNRIIQTSARMLGDKIDVRKEIETTLAAKKAEQVIMSFMPAGIILYLKLTSPGFLGVLYGNPFGICAMTLCLGIYGLSYWLGHKIVDIEV